MHNHELRSYTPLLPRPEKIPVVSSVKDNAHFAAKYAFSTVGIHYHCSRRTLDRRERNGQYNLAHLLRIDIQPILDKPRQDRMKCLFQSIDKIRPAIVFSDGPRIDHDGFRWAPSSFLRPEKHPREPGFHGRGMWAERHPMGLLVNFDGFLLPEPPVNNVFTISTEEQSYTVHLQPQLRPSQGERVAVIHEVKLCELENETFSTKAILVEVTRIEDGIQFTLFSGVGKIVRSIDVPCESIKVVSITSSRWCVG
jgi:hypothetical protein